MTMDKAKLEDLRKRVEEAMADLLVELDEADMWLGSARTRRRNAAIKKAKKRFLSALEVSHG